MYSHERAQSELVLIHHGFSPTTLLSFINHSMSIVERCVNLTNHVGSLLYASSPDVAGSCLESSNKQRKRKFIWINSLAPWRFWNVMLKLILHIDIMPFHGTLFSYEMVHCGIFWWCNMGFVKWDHDWPSIIKVNLKDRQCRFYPTTTNF